jgi:hypothetical protein
MIKLISAEKIFTLNHAGGDFLSVNVSGLINDSTRLWPIFDEMVELLKRPSTSKNIAFHIYDTVLSKETADSIISHLKEIESSIRRISFIGLTFRSKLLFKKLIKKYSFKSTYQFIFDINTAKDWLIGIPISN